MQGIATHADLNHGKQELQQAKSTAGSDLEAARSEATRQLQDALKKADSTQGQFAEANRAAEEAQSSLKAQQVQQMHSSLSCESLALCLVLPPSCMHSSVSTGYSAQHEASQTRISSWVGQALDSTLWGHCSRHTSSMSAAVPRSMA